MCKATGLLCRKLDASLQLDRSASRSELSRVLDSASSGYEFKSFDTTNQVLPYAVTTGGTLRETLAPYGFAFVTFDDSMTHLTLTSDGDPCPDTPVSITLTQSGVTVPVGTIATDEHGNYDASITLWFGLAVGDYDVHAVTQGSARCGVGQSK